MANITWRVQGVNREAIRAWLTCVTLLAAMSTLLPARAQAPLLERTVTVSLNRERIDIALNRISQQANLTFSYSPSAVDVSQLVTYEFAGHTVREVLEILFEGRVTYKVRGNYVILTRSAAPVAKEHVYSGYVVDEATGRRLNNVSVYDPVTLSSAVTDEYGFFQLKVDRLSAEEIRLAIARREYADTVIAVSTVKRGLLRVPMNVRQEKVASLADSVTQRLRRFWYQRIKATDMTNVQNISDTLYRRVQFSVFPMIGTNHKLSANIINDYSFNVFGGLAMGVNKFEMGGLFNLDRGDVSGVQLAGLFNGVGGVSHALQFAGLSNISLDTTRGVQFAGLINVNWRGTHRVAAAGLLNVTHGTSRGGMLAGVGNATIGAQNGPHIAGVFNINTQSVEIAQVAGVMNFSTGSVNGAQVSGALNFAAGNVSGAQVSGMLNVVGRRLKGAQAGVINYATTLHGAQIGVVNIADSVNGIPIGLLSFVLKGYHQIEISADEVFYTNVAFRTGLQHFYNIFTVGARPSSFEDDEVFWTAGYGFGTAPKISKRLTLNADVTANQIFSGYTLDALNVVAKAYGGIEYHPWKKIGFIAGITLNANYTDTDYSDYPQLFAAYQPHIVYEHTYANDVNVKMWWGAKIGLRFF